MRQFTKIIVGLTLLAHFCACNDEYSICDVNTDVYEKTGFYHIAGGIQQVAYAPLFTLVSIGSVNPIYNNLPNISKFNLPLNPLIDSGKFQLYISSTSVPDTITFIYINRTFTINPDCGNIYIHNLTRVSVTRHHLDSVSIVNHDVNNVSGENVRIYF